MFTGGDENTEQDGTSGEDLVVSKHYRINTRLLSNSRKKRTVGQLRKPNVKLDKRKPKKNVKKHDRKYVRRYMLFRQKGFIFCNSISSFLV